MIFFQRQVNSLEYYCFVGVCVKAKIRLKAFVIAKIRF